MILSGSHGGAPRPTGPAGPDRRSGRGATSAPRGSLRGHSILRRVERQYGRPERVDQSRATPLVFRHRGRIGAGRQGRRADGVSATTDSAIGRYSCSSLLVGQVFATRAGLCYSGRSLVAGRSLVYKREAHLDGGIDDDLFGCHFDGLIGRLSPRPSGRRERHRPREMIAR
jgi:hypothetical protein